MRRLSNSAQRQAIGRTVRVVAFAKAPKPPEQRVRAGMTMGHLGYDEFGCCRLSATHRDRWSITLPLSADTTVGELVDAAITGGFADRDDSARQESSDA